MSNLQKRIVTGNLAGCYFYTYHSHQPYFFADNKLMGNLKKMWFSGNDKDEYEAKMFYQCYLNPAQYLTTARQQGKSSASCMVDFSSTLLEQLKEMEDEEIFEREGKPSFFASYREVFKQYPDALELLLIPWSHPYLDGGCPARDLDRQLGRALELIEELFGEEVRLRVKGLFPPELGLPSNPDVLYTLLQCCHKWGIKWLIVNETSLEDKDGNALPAGYPYQLMVKNCQGQESSLTVLTRVHDVYQSEAGGHAAAKNNLQSRLGAATKPLMIGSAGDLENGGVMMNEHWGPWLETIGDSPESNICSATGTAFFEAMLAKLNEGKVDWEAAPRVFAKAYSKGGSWTYKSEHWNEGDNKESLNDLTEILSRFHNQLRAENSEKQTSNNEIKQCCRDSERALFIMETSCYRYWGDSGEWMETGFKLLEYAVNTINRFAEAVKNSRRLKLSEKQIIIS